MLQVVYRVWVFRCGFTLLRGRLFNKLSADISGSWGKNWGKTLAENITKATCQPCTHPGQHRELLIRQHDTLITINLQFSIKCKKPTVCSASVVMFGLCRITIYLMRIRNSVRTRNINIHLSSWGVVFLRMCKLNFLRIIGHSQTKK